MYEKYNELFFDQILENTGIKVAFDAFRDTSIFERYMLNAAQFSAAKCADEAKRMQAMVFDENGIKSFSRFEKDVRKIQQVDNEVYLRTEYEMARRQTVAIAQFTRFKDDADIYPYWVYRGRMDSRERPEHVAMEGKVFLIGDPAGDACFPPIDWNCRCTGDQADGRYLTDKNARVSTPEESRALLEQHVDEDFRYNASNHGAMPSKGSYFKTLPSANSANADTFKLLPPPKDGPQLTGLRAKGLHYIMNIVEDWRKDHHVDRDTIVFQNKRTLTNVRMLPRAVHDISRHAQGIDNLPRCIENPSEVWSKWENVGEQTGVLRAYILFGKTSYVVTTLNGVVLDGFPCGNSQIKKYRSGVII